MRAPGRFRSTASSPTRPSAWEPELDWEHDAYRWCGADEAVELLYWPEPRELVRDLTRAGV